MEGSHAPAYVVDGDASSWRSGHVEAATTLWEKAVPIRITAPDKEDKHAMLPVRILLGVAKHQHNSKILRVQITSEEDPFLLHTLEVTEDDFQSLKVEQGILVDFSTFPSKFIELLEACIENKDVETPRFTAVLAVGAGDSIFSLVETNLFKNLSHLALRFRPGNDAAIKQYLAERLFEVKGHRTDLRGKLESTQSELTKTQEKCEELRGSVDSLEQSKMKLATEMNAHQMEMLAEAKQTALAEMEAAKKSLEAERSNMEAQYRTTISTLEKRSDDLDANNRKLLDAKFTLESKVTELSAKMGSMEGEAESTKKELKKLRDSNKDLDNKLHEAEKRDNAKAVKLSGLEQQVKDKDELIKSLNARLSSAESHKASVESTLAETREALQGAERRATQGTEEVKKANEIIEHLQADFRAAKAKQKLKVAVIAQQENLLNERQVALDKAQRDCADLQRTVDSLQAEKASLKGRCDDQKSKLEESQGLLQSNQKMIEWLNQQVNEAQLGKLGSSSRYSFRPSYTPPAPSAPTPTIPTAPPTTSSSYRPPADDLPQVQYKPKGSAIAVGGQA